VECHLQGRAGQGWGVRVGCGGCCLPKAQAARRGGGARQARLGLGSALQAWAPAEGHGSLLTCWGWVQRVGGGLAGLWRCHAVERLTGGGGRASWRVLDDGGTPPARILGHVLIARPGERRRDRVCVRGVGLHTRGGWWFVSGGQGPGMHRCHARGGGTSARSFRCGVRAAATGAVRTAVLTAAAPPATRPTAAAGRTGACQVGGRRARQRVRSPGRPGAARCCAWGEAVEPRGGPGRAPGRPAARCQCT
jgi:hypothetical protein